MDAERVRWQPLRPDLTPVRDGMRAIKSRREIALIRRASQLAGYGLIEATRRTEPGSAE